MRTKSVIVFAVLMVLFAVAEVVSADPVLIHQFAENYYGTSGTGGTRIVDLGNPANWWTVGNVTGPVKWEVIEKVYWDTVAQTTQFTYTVINDSYIAPITAFSLLNPYGFQALTPGPEGWAFSTANGKWTWTALGSGIAQTQSQYLDVFVQGLIPVGFTGDTSITAGGTQTSSDWMVSSPAPEPGTLFLLGSGLAAAGFWGRKFFFRAQLPSIA